MAGGYLYFPKLLNDATTLLNFTGLISKPVAYAWGIQIFFGGLIFVFIAAFIQRRWAAFHELTNAIQVFADVLSYLRIYALALAGIIMAETFNEMGLNFGFFAGSLIILLGQFNTLLLSLMSAMIHGLRLNFLEWYHYSFEGDGKSFNPLKLIKR